MSAVIVIPARYDSTRFPGKPLAPLKGKPVIQHVYENSRKARSAADVMVATDSETIYERVLSFGGKAVMTSGDHVSGTDRIAEVAGSLSCDIIVNVQGDEPLMTSDVIEAAIGLLSDRRADMGTMAKKIGSPEDIMDPNVVKVVTDGEGYALYFSRAPIPYHRDEWKELDRFQVSKSRSRVFKHIGIYSYRREVLLRLAGMKPSRLEEIEKLEQLRALENGLKIKVGETLLETVGIDTPQDLERVEKWLSISS